MHFGIWMRAAALLLAAALSGCVAQNVNPVTGKTIYAPTSASIEAESGRKAREALVASHGLYQNAALTAYVDRVGQALARHAVRQNLGYTFAVLDDDDINAFALPGGYVYITRGALNFANSEAELAAILGHEIGHVDAFHFRHRERDTVSGMLGVLLRHSSDSAYDRELAEKLAEKSTKSTAYSQEQEFEADALGIHYMALAGYDPQGMVRALRSEQAKSSLDDGGMKDNPLAHDIFALDQSHPATLDRAARAAAAAKSAVPAPEALAGGAGPKIGRDAHLAALDGVPFGADAEEGTVDGRRLVNTVFGFSFEAPEGFDLWTDRGGAFGVGRNALLLLEAADGKAGQSMVSYVQSSMLEKMTVGDVRPLDLDGYSGAIGLVNVDPFVIRVGAVLDRDDNLYRLVYIAPRRAFDELDAGFVQSMKSFRPLKGGEAQPQPAPHIRIVTVAAGDTAETLARRMATPEPKLAWFRALNGLDPQDALQPGDKVKLVE